MQGDTHIVDGFLYETVDEQRCKCLTCSKVIYKLLQRAHSNSHSSSKVTQDQPVKPAVKAVKKFSLQPDLVISDKPAISISDKPGFANPSNPIDLPDSTPLPQHSEPTPAIEPSESIKPAEVAKNTEETKNAVRREIAEVTLPTNLIEFNLPQKNKNLFSAPVPIKRVNNRGSFLACLKKSQKIRGYLQKSINSFNRSLFVIYLKHFRIWKKRIL